MEIIIGLSTTAVFWITASIVVVRSNKKLKSGRKSKPAKVNTTYSKWSPEVDRLLEMELN